MELQVLIDIHLKCDWHTFSSVTAASLLEIFKLIIFQALS